MTKYRIRLSGGRVIGPFLRDQLFDLKAKGHLTGQEEAQIFPAGSWSPISSFDFYAELMDPNRTAKSELSADKTFVIDLTKLRQKNAEQEIEKLELVEIAATEAMTETKVIDPPPSKQVEPKLELTLDPHSELTAGPPNPTRHSERQAFEVAIEDIESVDSDMEERENKTILNPIAQKELEKFREKQVLEAEQRKNLEARKEEEDKKKKEADALAERLREEEKDESTRVLNLMSIKKDLLQVAAEEDAVIVKVAKEIIKRKEEDEAKKRAEEGNEDEEDEDEGGAKKKKNKLIIIIAALALGYAFLFPDKNAEKPPFKVIPPRIEFPIPFDHADTKAGTINFDTGKELFTKGGYVNLISAGLLFKNSYENNMENHAALSLLVRTYSEELKYSKDKLVDAQTVFNIIQSKRPWLLKEPNGAIGMNQFYMAIGKYEAAVDVTAKYLKLNPKNLTPDLFAAYLKSLIKVGKLEVANQINKALEKAPDKNRYAYEALIEYSTLNQENDKAEEYVDDAIKKNPELVPFYLMKAEMLIKKKKFKESEPFLKKANFLNLEYNDVNRAKFMELMGLLLASKGKVKEATALFTESLKLDDSLELRMTLAGLDASGTESSTEKLISESKAIKLLNQAKKFLEQRNYELAMSAAARATDAYPGHIPSEMFLAKVQLKLGLAEQAIRTLEELLKKYSDNKDLNYAMIEAYIDTYKFNDAKNRIAIIASVDEMKNTWEYASLNARLYQRMGDSLQTVSWLKASMNMNPLNDKDIFMLAETYLKRNNFDAAQVLLNKCMELDPVNPDYRIAYAKLVYEKEDDQAAIGYLLTLQEEFGENPKFLSEIAIMYYRAGKVKDFENYKDKLAKLPTKDKALYEFLIKAALLDERYSEIPEYVEQLLRIEPGELEAMMTAGRVLFENGKLKESALWFKRIQDKLSTYPKVQYYIAKIKLLAGEIEDAKGKDDKPLLDDKGKPILGALGLVLKDIKENGENDASLVLLAEIYIQKGELIEAENTYKKAQKINPRSYDALVGMADISTKRNNHDLALDLYKKALNLKGDEPILHKKMGDVYRLIGQGALALESYKLYLDMNPDASDKAQIESYINLMQ